MMTNSLENNIVPKSLRWTAWILTAAALATMVGASAPRNLPKAIDTQMELQRQRPQDPKVANDLGNLLVLARRIAEAEAAYQRAIELAPGDPVPLYNLALLYQRQGDVKESLEMFKEVVALDPGNAWAHYQLGALYEALDEKSRAVTAYGQAFALNPDLASSDTNPQVIDSKWVVEALLAGYRAAVQQPLAPRAYEDPNRIALLMISAEEERLAAEDEDGVGGPEEESTGAEATLSETADPKSEGAAASGGSRRGSGTRSNGTGSSKSARKVLTPDTIERGGTLGQVGSSRSTRPRSRQTTRRPLANRRRNTNLTARRSGSTTVSEDSALNPRQRSTGRVRYRPSTRSTGSLDLELGPAQDPVVPAG